MNLHLEARDIAVTDLNAVPIVAEGETYGRTLKFLTSEFADTNVTENNNSYFRLMLLD